MGRGLKIVTMLTLCLVLVAGVTLGGCGKDATAELVKPTIEFTQYLKGATVDFDDATLNQMAEGGGEPGFKFGLAASVYPSKYTQAIRDQWANIVFPPPYKVLETAAQADQTTFAMLDAGDQTAVNGAIYANVLTAAEREVIETMVLPGFFNRVDNDMADGKALKETSAYAILADGAGAAAANAWADEVADGDDYADRFFIRLVKQHVGGPFAVMFEEFWVAVYGEILADPTDEQVEAVARIAGETSFRNGTAGTMYPELRDPMAQDLFEVDYADLEQHEAPQVDAAIYQSLPSAFGNVSSPAFMPTVNAVRDGVAGNLEAVGMVSAPLYADLPGTEQAFVNQVIFSQLGDPDKPLGFGPALEWDYITFAAVPGAVMGWGAEIADEKPLDQNQAYQALNAAVSYTAAEGWKADVEAGVHPRQAYYRWLALEAVRGMAAASLMIRMSVGEFSFKVTNPNDYDISIDRLDFTAQVTTAALGEGNEVDADAAKLSLGDRIYIPANSDINIMFNAPTKAMDVLVWQVVGGVPSDDARAIATDVFNQIQAGTAEFAVTLDATVSGGDDTLTETYSLSWSAEE